MRNDPEKCIERVYVQGQYRTKQCSRKKGYGPGREYCTQHAMTHAKDPIRYVWVYGKSVYALSNQDAPKCCTVVAETDKVLRISGLYSIAIGSDPVKKIDDPQWRVFDTQLEAEEWMVEWLDRKLEATKAQVLELEERLRNRKKSVQTLRLVDAALAIKNDQ